MKFPRIFIVYEWRYPKVIVGLFILEFFLTVATLTLFGVADPDTYRTKLWQNGFDKGFNSPPNEILYSYANYQPIHVPLVWSSFLTQFNIVISVLSMFILLVKTTMYIMEAWLPIISTGVNTLLVILYSLSIRNQSAPDLSDPAFPSPGLPWYLSKGCSFAEPGNFGYCMQARASFAVTCVMVALFSTYLIYSIWNTIPTKQEKAERAAARESDIELRKVGRYDDDPDSDLTREEKWERNRQIFLNLPKTPNTPGFGVKNPMTPRTVAFTALNGGPAGPTRAQPGMGPTSGPSGPLPFRQRYGNDKGVPDAR